MRTRRILIPPLTLVVLLLLLVGCGFLKKISTNRFDRMEHGPADSAIVVVDVSLHASEVPEVEDLSFQEELEGLFRDGIANLLGVGQDSEELESYALEPDGGQLESAGGTARGFSVRGHLVFVDVSPGEVRLTSLRGHRPIPSLQQRELYECQPTMDAGSQCPEYWVHEFCPETPITARVEAGQVLYLGRVAALGYCEPPPYRSFTLAAVESWNNTWLEKRADSRRVDMVGFSTTSTPREERAALTDLRDRIDKDEWKAAIGARLRQLEVGGI